jgi:parallel beta-helix repeat protein
MNKKAAVLFVILIAILVFALFYFIINFHVNKVVNIDTGKEYATIQEAIDANETLNGHTLLVYPGVYHEYVKVDKTLTIKGQSRDETIVERGSTSVIIILVTANSSTVANLTVRDSTFGIWCRDVKNCSVLNNKVINCTTGIRRDRSGSSAPVRTNCLVKDNEVLNGTLRGIHLYNVSDNTVTDNFIQRIEDVGGSYAAIDVELSSNNTIVHNQLSNNYCGIWINIGASSNTVYHNDFINNTLQVKIWGENTTWDDGSRGNYWSDYKGTDANGDGIGDTPYVIAADNKDRYPLMVPEAFP